MPSSVPDDVPRDIDLLVSGDGNVLSVDIAWKREGWKCMGLRGEAKEAGKRRERKVERQVCYDESDQSAIFVW